MLILAAIACAVCALIAASLMAGSSDLSLREVLAGLFMVDDHARIIVWNLRMPRILTALIGGVALAIAGCAFQSVLRNPLASASTLGISQGAAFGASVAIIVVGAGGSAMFEGVTFGNPYITAVCAFLGAVASSVIILVLSKLRSLSPESIVLAGVALSAVFTGATALIQYFAEDTQVAAVVFWTFGDLGRVSYRELAIIGAVTLIASLFFACNRWNLNAVESGEHSAHSLGVDTKALRLSSVLMASAAASTVIAFCGTINFIGLAAPHIARRLIGDDYRYLLAGSAVTGAGLLLLSDLLARTLLAPIILPISAITSFVGAPVFLYLLMKGARR